MNRFFGLLLVMALWANSSSLATNSGITDIVKQSLRTGSAEQLASYFDTNIELIIDTEAIDFSSVQATHAEFILKSFFRKYPPRHFQYVYQGTSAHKQYSTGTYQAGQDQFKVYVLMEEVSHGKTPYSEAGQHQYRIHTLHFRKAD